MPFEVRWSEKDALLAAGSACQNVPPAWLEHAVVSVNSVTIDVMHLEQVNISERLPGVFTYFSWF